MDRVDAEKAEQEKQLEHLKRALSDTEETASQLQLQRDAALQRARLLQQAIDAPDADTRRDRQIVAQALAASVASPPPRDNRTDSKGVATPVARARQTPGATPPRPPRSASKDPTVACDVPV